MKFTLSKPITIEAMNGSETISELELDFDSLSLSDIKAAKKIKSLFTESRAGIIDNSTVSPRMDEDLRIGLSWVAAMKTDSRISYNDILKLNARDALELSEVALSEYLFR